MSLPKLLAEDKNRVELLNLKVANVRLQMELLKNSADRATAELQGYQQEMLTLRDELSTKYGVDFDKVRILPDGQLVEAK